MWGHASTRTSSARRSWRWKTCPPSFPRAAPPLVGPTLPHPAGHVQQQWEQRSAAARAPVRSRGCCHPARGAREHPWRGVAAGGWQRIGRINGILRRHRQHAPQRAAAASPERPGARRCTALRGFGGYWTYASGWGGVAPQGCPGATASGRATWEGWGGEDVYQRGEFIHPPYLSIFLGNSLRIALRTRRAILRDLRVSDSGIGS